MDKTWLNKNTFNGANFKAAYYSFLRCRHHFCIDNHNTKDLNPNLV